MTRLEGEKMKKIIVFVIASVFCAPCFADQKKISYKAASAIYDELGKPLEATSTWLNKPLHERLEEAKKAEAFVEKTELVFGTAQNQDWSTCRAAAIYRKFYIYGLNDLALILEGKKTVTSPADLFAPLLNSESFGENKARCSDYVDSLYKKK